MKTGEAPSITEGALPASQGTRIILPSGGWWEINPTITHRDKRRIDRGTTIGMAEMLKDLGDVDLSKLKDSADKASSGGPMLAAAEDVMLLRCSSAWSFDGPIDTDSILDREEEDVAVVLAAMKTRYNMGPTSEAKEELKKDSLTP